MAFLRANLELWWKLLALSWRCARWLCALCLLTLLLDIASTTLTGVAMHVIVSGSMRNDLTEIWWGAIGAALAYAIMLTSSEVGGTLRIVLGSKLAYEDIEYRVWRSTMELETIDHLERPTFLNRLTQLHTNPGSWPVVNSLWVALDAGSTVLRLAVVLALLGTVNPLLLLVPVIAIVPLVLGQRGQAAVRQAQLESAPDYRTQRHYFTLATNAAGGKEIRVAGVGRELVRRQRRFADSSLAHQARAQFRAMGLEAFGWVLFSTGFAGGLALVVHDAAGNPALVGDVVLTVVVGLQLRTVIQAAVTKAATGSSNGPFLAAYHWLLGYRAEQDALRPADPHPAPARIASGIAFEQVTFDYPGAAKSALRDVSFVLPAGSVCAIVGEYGSGKTTIVKLLAKLYRPKNGRIAIDGVDLADIDATQWRLMVSSAFQDFGRYQTTVADNIAIGDLHGTTDLSAAVEAADAKRLIERLPEKAQTPLGKQFGGVDLSEGQWQKLALARASRRRPLLMVLDEPTASLDAPSEHAVFERYMRRARSIARETGGITVVVTHRFSTVAGADRILCVDGGRVVEDGTHDELLARGGRYARLYRLQAEAYLTHAGREDQAGSGSHDH